MATICLFIFAGCHKDSNDPRANLLHKWTLISQTGIFPTMHVLNFYDQDSPNDYFSFSANGTVNTNITEYLPFGIDTASYVLGSQTIFFRDDRNYGVVFQHQINNGVLVDTTTAQIVVLSNNLLVLGFPTESTIDSNGNVTYFHGTLIDSLTR